MVTLRFLGTKTACEEVMIHLCWERFKLWWIVYSVIGSGGITVLMAMFVDDSPLYSFVFCFAVIFYFIRKGMPKTSARCTKIIVNRAWKSLPSGKTYLELDEEKGLKKVFSETDKPIESKEKPIFTKVECVRGHTVIFCNVGKRKDQIWFVADEDVTDFLNSWMKARNLLCHEGKGS